MFMQILSEQVVYVKVFLDYKSITPMLIKMPQKLPLSDGRTVYSNL